ncbi:hypothetical protein F5888DRAFT_1706018 [Russula emetica]|nr:hypothetical protein F5888DRAFT_1706018 [Russula emetica]
MANIGTASKLFTLSASTGRYLLYMLCLIFCTVLLLRLSRGLIACWCIQSSTYLLGSTTVYRGFPTSAARRSLVSLSLSKR